MSERKWIDRKEIAIILEISVFQVRSGEERLGLAPVRKDLNARCVRYHRIQALKALRDRGLLSQVS